jgi:fatty acid desaturase
MCSVTSKALTADLETSAFKSLFTTKPHVHGLAMAWNWCIILLTVYLCQTFTFWLYPMAVIVIGARMHALAILMHDATHYRFLKNRKWNDLISNMVIMYPLFTSIEKYRANHLRHHQHLNTMEDPDWVAKLTNRAFHFPKTKASFLLTIGSYLTFYQGILDALWFLQRFGSSTKKETGSRVVHKALPICFYLVLFSFLSLAGLWQSFILFWVFPYLTSFFMFQYIRSVAEHFGELAYEDDLSSTRTIITNPIEKFFIAPHQVSYHLEHHLYPGVPFYHLPELHRLLMGQKQYRKNAHLTYGYFNGLLQELGKA